MRRSGADSQQVRVVYFVEDQFPPQTLAYLWQRMLDDHQRHPNPHLFTTGKPPGLNQFIRGFSAQAQVILLLALAVPENTEPQLEHCIGFIWLDHVEVAHKADAHFTFFRDAWGGLPLAAVREGLRLVFAPPLDLQVIVCRMNAQNTLGVNFMKRLGVQMVGTIPGWYQDADGLHAAVMGYIEREAFLAQTADEPATTPVVKPSFAVPPLRKDSNHATSR